MIKGGLPDFIFYFEATSDAAGFETPQVERRGLCDRE
jgi:hypothetical protein